ncbi:RNA processing factor 1 [Trypanosoma cruzi]|nr:RNA processing factor 1 [Trypanosoma cruzi]
MGKGARSKRGPRGPAKKQHAPRHRAAEVDPALVELYRSTRQPVKKSQLFEQLREQKKDAKRVRREARERERKQLKENAPAKAIPKTKERLRRPDVTIVEEKDDAEIVRDEADDEFAAYYNEARKPSILITTGEHPCFRTKQFVKEALWLFPNSTYRPRKDYTLKEITQFCINREFTDLVVITDRLKEPYNLIISHLPEGPHGDVPPIKFYGTRTAEGSSPADRALPRAYIQEL